MNSTYGLNFDEVIESRKKYGENKLTRRKKKSLIRQFAMNLGDPVIRILLCALAVNILFLFKKADWFETAGIAVAVFLATFISTLSEYGSEAAFEKLYEESSKSKCRVRRNGQICEIATSELVVGDIVIIGAGEGIPADGVLLAGSVTVDQSAMTGESRGVEKSVGEGDKSTLFSGTTVLYGECEFAVTKVGDNTLLGGISREIQTDTRISPLKLRLTKLAKTISYIGYAASGLVAFAYLVNTFVIDSNFDLILMKEKITDIRFLLENLMHAFTLGLTVIVVAVPEGLPMMIAVVLSANIKRMVKDNVLVRKPTGIEAAGSMNILFTDKTGTLTYGRPDVVCYLTPFGEEKSLGCAIGEKIKLQAAVNCAAAGNSTDRAIATFVSEKLKKVERKDVFPFDSRYKYSAASAKVGDETYTFIKGAPEILLPHISKYTDNEGKGNIFSKKSGFAEKLKKYANDSSRLILLAECSGNEVSKLRHGVFPDLTLQCVLVLRDKVRKNAADHVKALNSAGIGVVMITGDSIETASAVASECGILTKKRNIVLDSKKFARLSDSEISGMLDRLAVVARALPSDKSRLVKLSQELGMVVGMTGDGINDAPALKRSDIGFALGSGTQVAKDAGDIIILDDDLGSVVRSVLYGRNIFKSIRKFISLQLTMNLSAVGVSMICPFLGIDAPVTVVQMLWINIIMDTLGGLAFSGEAASYNIMKEKPKKRDEDILTWGMVKRILFLGCFTIALSIYFLKSQNVARLYRPAADDIYHLTAFFALFIFAGVINCFNCRALDVGIFDGLSKNPTFIFIMLLIVVVQIIFIYLGGAVLRTAPLTALELLWSFLYSLSVLAVGSLERRIGKKV